jgi:hypothetical protein
MCTFYPCVLLSSLHTNHITKQSPSPHPIAKQSPPSPSFAPPLLRPTAPALRPVVVCCRGIDCGALERSCGCCAPRRGLRRSALPADTRKRHTGQGNKERETKEGQPHHTTACAILADGHNKSTLVDGGKPSNDIFRCVLHQSQPLMVWIKGEVVNSRTQLTQYRGISSGVKFNESHRQVLAAKQRVEWIPSVKECTS